MLVFLEGISKQCMSMGVGSMWVSLWASVSLSWLRNPVSCITRVLLNNIWRKRNLLLVSLVRSIPKPCHEDNLIGGSRRIDKPGTFLLWTWPLRYLPLPDGICSSSAPVPDALGWLYLDPHGFSSWGTGGPITSSPKYPPSKDSHPCRQKFFLSWTLLLTLLLLKLLEEEITDYAHVNPPSSALWLEWVFLRTRDQAGTV